MSRRELCKTRRRQAAEEKEKNCISNIYSTCINFVFKVRTYL